VQPFGSAKRRIFAVGYSLEGHEEMRQRIIESLRVLYRSFCPPILQRMAAEWRRKMRMGDYHSIFELDRKIEKYIDYDNGYFVELGANDGVSFSNTLYYENKRGWHGVLVEPTPHNYIKCRSNRGSKNKIYCAACVSFEYSERFVPIIYSNMMSTALGLESDNLDPWAYAKSGLRYLTPAEDVFVYGAVAATLNQLLIQADAPKQIGLLSLDVEGAEIEVLKGVDHNVFRFSYILIESQNFERTKEYLDGCGYAFVERLSVHDYFFRDIRT
jgi:FkbM family methyltransferase